MSEITVEGFRIAYERAGDGPPLVLLHGALCDTRVWRPQIDALSDAFDVIAWDAPGCGRSSDPPDGFSLSDYARCLAAFLEELGIERAHLLGMSWGGGLAIALYEVAPGVPQSLVLCGAYAGWGGSLPAEVVAERLERALRDAKRPADEWVPEWVSTLMTDAAPPEAVEGVTAMTMDGHPAAFPVMARGFAEADLNHVLPRIGVPTLLLWGAEDARSPLAVAETLHERIPGSTLVTIPGAGHLSNVEAPERFNDEVRAFLRAAAR